MPESFTLDTSCSPRPIIVTASGRIIEASSEPDGAPDVETGEPVGPEPAPPARGGRRPRAKVLTPPPAAPAATGATPTAK